MALRRTHHASPVRAEWDRRCKILPMRPAVSAPSRREVQAITGFVFSLKCRRSAEHELPAVASTPDSDSQWCKAGTVETHLNSHIVLEAMQIESAAGAGDLARVEKECHVDARTIWNPSKLALYQQTVPVTV